MIQLVIVEKNSSNTNARARAAIEAAWPRIVCNKREDGLFDVEVKNDLHHTAAVGVVVMSGMPSIGGVPLIPAPGDVLTLGKDRFCRIVLREFSPTHIGLLAEAPEEMLRAIADGASEGRILPATMGDIARVRQ